MLHLFISSIRGGYGTTYRCPSFQARDRPAHLLLREGVVKAPEGQVSLLIFPGQYEVLVLQPAHYLLCKVVKCFVQIHDLHASAALKPPILPYFVSAVWLLLCTRLCVTLVQAAMHTFEYAE